VPDGWGRRVIARDHAKMRKDRLAEETVTPVVPSAVWDYLMGVDDVSCIGAIRFPDENDQFVRSAHDGGRRVPPLFELVSAWSLFLPIQGMILLDFGAGSCSTF
jgi:serine/threonine-protein kinase HipA